MSLKTLTKDELIKSIPNELYEEILNEVKKMEFGGRQEYVMITNYNYSNEIRFYKREFFDEYFEITGFWSDKARCYHSEKAEDEDKYETIYNIKGDTLITGVYGYTSD